MEDILIQDSTQSQLTFGSTTPSVTQANGTVLVQTFSHMDYDLDPLDFNNHLSAKWGTFYLTRLCVKMCAVTAGP